MAMISPLSLDRGAPSRRRPHSSTPSAIKPGSRSSAGCQYGDTAQAAFTKVHLAEQNRSEALREFKRYHDLLRAELDIGPSTELRRVLDPPPDDVTPR
jgi:hypothetical protein